MKIILASASQNRHNILNQAHIKHIVIPSRIDESEIEDKDPKKRIVKVATAKASAIAAKEPNALIIGADSYGLYRNKILEKPKFKMDAVDTLKMLSGRGFEFMTGWNIVNTKTGKSYTGLAETRVFVRELSDQEILDYVNDHDVVKWAVGLNPGANRSVAFISKISGSVTNYSHGLPLEQIIPTINKEK